MTSYESRRSEQSVTYDPAIRHGRAIVERRSDGKQPVSFLPGRNATRFLASVVPLLLIGGWALAGIEGSKHDFSDKEWSGGNACSACHTPAKDKPPTAAPLWDADADLNRTFGTPLRQSARAGLGTTMCLRCHDGTIARDTIGGVSRERFPNKEHPGLFQAGHGGSDHPVGVEYPKFDREYRPEPSVVAEGAVALPDGKVECISCHDPHDMSGEKYMLVLSNARSALCLTCHRK